MFKTSIFLLLLAASALADDAPAYREVACRIVDEGGHCVSDVEVQLRGLERDALRAGFEDEKSDKYRGWKFKTDSAGLFTARFGKFRQYDHEQATGLIEPGYGHFYFVARQEGCAGGVSSEVLNLNDEELAEYKKHEDDNNPLPKERDEWVRGEFPPYVLPDKNEGKPLEIVLKRGLDLTGRIVDTAGRPMRDEEVNVFLDLGAGSHTGHGGEIFEQQATTDRAGHFRFRHIYPNTFYVELIDHSAGPPFWIRTRVRNRWVDKVEDQITPRQDEWHPLNYEKSIDLRLIVSREPTFRYFGRVTDMAGRGVADAKVEIRCSLHEPERTFEDGHDYWWKTKTDRNGDYSLRVGWRFVNAIWVTAGDNIGADNVDEGDLMAPGRYDITVRLKKAGE
jgi:protocatechuate 3,4-dioxygenase beta subunit